MLSKLRTARRIFRQEGGSAALELALKNLFGYQNAIDRARLKVGRELTSFYDNRVGKGPFTGMRLPKSDWWAAEFVAAARILGTYESQVVSKLKQFSNSSSIFVDIGAADGYFAIGALYSGMYDECFAFEISERARSQMLENAHLNDVTNRLVVASEASLQSLTELMGRIDHAVFLIDIEGAEFDLLSDNVLDLLKGCHLIIEMHDSLMRDGPRKRRLFDASVRKYFDIEILKSADIEVSQYTALSKYKDNLRLLAFSEGRRCAMEWVVLHPKGTL